jgi:hypothetical protein
MNPCTRRRVDPKSRSWTPIRLTTRTDYEFTKAEARDRIDSRSETLLWLGIRTACVRVLGFHLEAKHQRVEN